MDIFQRLVSTALMGTQRQLPEKIQGDDELSQILKALDWQQPEKALLAAAGTIAIYAQVGSAHTLSLPNLPAIEPCEPDTKPCCNRQVTKHLETAIQEQPVVLPEFLTLVASAGQSVTPKLLPPLLALGTTQRELRANILPVLGQRGQWLAAQNSDWHYAMPVSIEDFSPESKTFEAHWQNGTRQARLSFLLRWRECHPAAMRDFLAQEWSAETAKDRERFITVFAQHLSMADECFLEQALEDRAKGVRKAAIALLKELPDSRLYKRMSERLGDFIQRSGQGKNFKISVSLPAQYDSSWAKDGIEPKAQDWWLGERAGWLQQMVASAPLSMWQVEPAVAVNAVEKSEWRDVFLTGWAIAAKTQQNEDWAKTLFTLLGANEVYQKVTSPLLSVLPSKAQQTYLKAAVPKQTNSQDIAQQLTHWINLATQTSQRWDLAFSRLIFTQVVRLLTDPKEYGGILISQTDLALTLHPGLAPEAAQIINNLSAKPVFITPWERFFDTVLTLLKLRWEIYQAFAEDSKSR
ncbi:MAG: DUF5691 domain-containing protein [Phormidesmis sp.]